MGRWGLNPPSWRERKRRGKEETWNPFRPWRNRASEAAEEDPCEEEISSSSRQKKPHQKGGGGGVGITTSVPYTRDQIQEFLRQHDRTGDSSLSRAELKRAFQDMGSRFPGLRTWQAMTAVGAADGDGRINEEEMEDLVNYVTRLNLRNQLRP